ncbi:MAG: AAA family ATPase, partial [Bacteroidota bacterium]
VVTYLQFKYIIELKIWRGEKQHGKGLDQLANYLDAHNINKGYLVIFDTRKNKTWDTKTIKHQDKDVFAVWV